MQIIFNRKLSDDVIGMIQNHQHCVVADKVILFTFSPFVYEIDLEYQISSSR